MIPKEILGSLASYFEKTGSQSFRVIASAYLSGGSINNVYRLTTTQGNFCLKFNHAGTYPRMFETEAMGLELLASSGEIRVPRPVFHDDLRDHTFLLLEYIEASKPRSDMMHDFGRSLARMHRHHAARFGLGHDNYMGSLPQRNTFHDRWTEFFVNERLEPQVKLAVDKGLAGSEAVQLFGSLFTRLESLFPVEPPSMVHGDLWNGNYIVSDTGTAALIDPAACYGHREADLAMTTLFGGFSTDFYEGYTEEYPPEKGWKERLDLYNLYPLLIHLNLFGQSYWSGIRSILGRF